MRFVKIVWRANATLGAVAVVFFGADAFDAIIAANNVVVVVEVDGGAFVAALWANWVLGFFSVRISSTFHITDDWMVGNVI